MSVSQFKRFAQCEARALSELKGEWESSASKQALIVGNYVHSYFESDDAHAAFKEENKDELFSKRKPHGLLKAFEVAEQMIERLETDRFFNYLWNGDKEVIIQEELFGVEWKAKIDLLNVEKGYFVDLKTAKDLNSRYFNKKYGSFVSFIEEYGYALQIAVYEKLLEKRYNKPFTGYIFAVTKQTPSDIAAIEIEQNKKEFELDQLEQTIERVEKVKNGEVKPEACGHCEFCRENKRVSRFISTADLLS